MKGIWIFTNTIFLILAPIVTIGNDILFIRSELVDIFFEESLRSLADEILIIYPNQKAFLENLTGWKIDFIPKFFLLKNQRFVSWVGDNKIVAVASSSDYQIIIDSSKINIYPFTLPITIRHELSHLLLDHQLKQTFVPKWLNEGFAQWVSDGISEMMVGNQTYLKKASIQNRLIPIKDLVFHFPEAQDQRILAYEQSKSFIDFIHNSYGHQAVITILNSMAHGNSIEDAVSKTISLSLDKLEHQWHQKLQSKSMLFFYLSSYLYEILFFVAAVLLIIGFIRYHVKRKHWQDSNDDDKIE